MASKHCVASCFFTALELLVSGNSNDMYGLRFEMKSKTMRHASNSITTQLKGYLGVSTFLHYGDLML